MFVPAPYSPRARVCVSLVSTYLHTYTQTHTYNPHIPARKKTTLIAQTRTFSCVILFPPSSNFLFYTRWSSWGDRSGESNLPLLPPPACLPRARARATNHTKEGRNE
ncbi:hypothetical protein DM02DRAFT_276435 [Periconia macrospinosa]|uniref:Uncharacterized protein n=1 Tax=Periconia macrospinosa TaxID=97972 RepID=A0A2V1D370_9PLEO|nr:hypothetical protein DM02DRAFT_276435 [Periconia macrospinosa]